MQVKIKKIHKSQEKLFKVGDIVELTDKGELVKSNIDNQYYRTKDLCKAFSNSCSLPDIFEKIEK